MKKPVARKSLAKKPVAKKPSAKKSATKVTRHQKAEKELTAFGLQLPETDVAPGWATTRCLRVRGKMFCVFGAERHKADVRPDKLSIILKLPISAEMVQDLYFVKESQGWYKQHDWIIAQFDAEDDILAEMETLKAWVIQSYCAMAPKKLAKQVMAERDRNEGKAF
jgi:YjbR